MNEPHDPREAALRRLPLPYSLALRLRDTGIADELLCDYLGVDPDALPALLSLAQAKLAAAMDMSRSDPYRTCARTTQTTESRASEEMR